MLSADTLEKVRLKDNRLFSDMFNAVLFHGDSMIHPSSLHDCDSNESSYMHLFGINRMRDVIKQYHDGRYIVFIGIENQSYHDDTMPFRVLSYDFINYLNQNKIFHRQKKAVMIHNQKYPFNKKKIPKLQFNPVMTIVLNYGERSWNQKIHLKGMMKDIPEEFQDYVNDWQIKVIDIKDVPYQNFHQKENRDLVEGIQRLYGSQGDIEVLKDMDISQETAIELCILIKSPEILEIVKEIKEEEFSMCTAIDIYTKRTMEKGKAIGFEEGEMYGIEKGRSIGFN